MSKEFTIWVEEKDYFPGDIIKGHIKLDLKRSADIQFITLNFKGTAEALGEKISLLDKTEILASPKTGQKYTVFNKNQVYTFPFEFVIPKDKLLPSHTRISKIANIYYVLTATPKQRLLNFSNSLSPIIHPIKILDFININLPEYAKRAWLNSDLGFVNGSKITQWNLVYSKSAFMKGDTINIECNINNFPEMKKLKAIKISLLRHVYKTSSAKIIDKKILSFKSIDLHVTESTSTQSIYIKLQIPSDTPASIFPNTGRILSLSYCLQAELNMKGVKSAIKLKDTYMQETAIVIGTYSDASLLETNIYPVTKASTISHRNSSVSTLQSQMSFHSSAVDSAELGPLERLDSDQAQKLNVQRKSYLNRSHTPIPKDLFIREVSPEPTHKRQSYNPIHQPVDRSLTPLPSVRLKGSNTVSYTQQSQRKFVYLQPEPSAVTISSPHEIGPNDIINRGDGGGREYFFRPATQYSDKEQVPSLIRHDTVSTASSAELH
ncbi:hypothetical protein BDF21DRAFT_428079 [Thamnidium elegans]|nr:hypothetical protein BDF21DRAFT_428079 [Thamnidium elegans]